MESGTRSSYKVGAQVATLFISATSVYIDWIKLSLGDPHVRLVCSSVI